MNGLRKFSPLLVVTPLALALDQWTKYLAVVHLTHALTAGGAHFYSAMRLLAYRAETVRVASFWDFRYAENTGAAFSFMAGTNDSLRVPFFYLVAVAATALILYFYVKSGPEHWLRRLALAMVLGGAFGNTLDRVVHGYVIDFILWHVGPHEWPVFNVADSFVCVGVFLLLTEGWFTKRLEGAAATTPSKAAS
ncbi:MAG: signal peptidase II [Deltaproteobacteria bacterium]|nr:signal peptidase II [Deltaproteobacteria bacterium]